MSFKKVLKMLNKLGEAPATSDKKILLAKYMDNKLFKKVVIYCLHGLYHYHINNLDSSNNDAFILKQKKTKISDVFKQLDYLRTAKGANQQDKQLLHVLAKRLGDEAVEVVTRIVKKDLRCGVMGKTINAVVPNTLRLMPYQRCSTVKKMANIIFDNDEEVALPNVIAQEKADGAFVNVLINKSGQVRFLTRNGKVIRQLGHLKKKIKNQSPVIKYGGKRGIDNDSKKSFYGVALNGELRVFKKGKFLPRQEGNGIINQCIQGTASKADAKCVVLAVWLCIPLKDFWNGSSPNSYSDNMFAASTFVHIVGDKKFIKLIESEYVSTYEEAEAFYKKIRKAGGEGVILKLRTTKWKSHTSVTMIKMKKVIDVELKLIGWYHGKKGKKYEKCIGGLIAETSCGKMQVRIGTGEGLTDKFRGYHPKRNQKGKIIDPMKIHLKKAQEACDDVELQEGAILGCECESEIKSKTKDKHSLFLPRFNEYRFDKDEADTLQDIMER